MRIQWNIHKKRGNFRPVLAWTITLETFEIDLAVDALTIKSLIPRVPNSHQAFCLPGVDERVHNWAPERYHYLSLPSVTYIKNREIRNNIRLPFRESGEYPEVEESFEMLKTSYEDILRQTYGHGPISERGEMDISSDTKKMIAAKVAGAKLLNLYGQDMSN